MGILSCNEEMANNPAQASIMSAARASGGVGRREEKTPLGSAVNAVKIS
jgi:hypothetical protein